MSTDTDKQLEQPNLLRHLVNDELGASSLLATLLDPAFNHPLQLEFLNHMRGLLREVSIDVPDVSPTKVFCEYRLIDVLVVWGNWILAIENKVAAASISRGQLKRYYHRLVHSISRDDILGIPDGSAQIGIVFLTPTPGMGGTEFQSLELDSQRSDGKLHLSWSGLLDWLDDHRSAGSDDTYRRVIQDGASQVHAILTDRSQTKTVYDENRQGMREFISELKNTIQVTLRPNGSMKIIDWHDPQLELIYTNVSGGSANVYFKILAKDSDCSDPGELDMNILFEFKVAAKAPAWLKQWFSDQDHRRFAGLIGLLEKAIAVDTDRGSIKFEQRLQGTRLELVEDVANTFFRLVFTFGSLIRMKEESDPQ